MASGLTGAALLALMKEKGKDLPENQLAIEAGWCTKRRNGTTVAHVSKMFRHALAATGVEDFVAPATEGRQRANGFLRVGKRGLISLTGAYTRQLGLAEGDEVKLEVAEVEGLAPVLEISKVIATPIAPPAPPEDEDEEDEEDEDDSEEITAIDPSRLLIAA
jgi:hypothetical protein